MRPLPLICLFFVFNDPGFAQPQKLQCKEGRKEVKHWWVGQEFTFQSQDRSWHKGDLVRLTKDSFYLHNRVVHYSPLGMDTLNLGVAGYTFGEIYALPKYGYPINYVNGRYEVTPHEGGMHFYWFKSGYLFRLAASTYAGVWLANGIIQQDLLLKDGDLAVAAGVFALGVLMHQLYKPYVIIGRKRHFEVVG